MGTTAGRSTPPGAEAPPLTEGAEKGLDPASAPPPGRRLSRHSADAGSSLDGEGEVGRGGTARSARESRHLGGGALPCTSASLLLSMSAKRFSWFSMLTILPLPSRPFCSSCPSFDFWSGFFPLLFPAPFSGLLATPAACKGIDDRHAGMGHVGDVARGDGHSVGEGGGGNLGVEVGPSPALYLSMTLPTSPRALSGLQALARMRTVGPLPGSSVQSLKSGEQ